MKKKILIIIGAIITIFLFASMILPNLIGVPIAAYEAQKAWSQEGNATAELIQETEKKFSFPKSVGIVNDFGGVFTETQEKELSQILYDYDIETTRQIVVATIDSISPYVDIQKYASDLGNEWGVGDAEKDNGLILVLCKPERKIAIATGYRTELTLTDEVCKSVIDSTMVPLFKEENYYKGIKAGVAELILKWE